MDRNGEMMHGFVDRRDAQVFIGILAARKKIKIKLNQRTVG